MQTLQAPTSFLEAYLRAIRKTPLLTAEEEKALGYRIQAGDRQARDELVCSNLLLVVHVARRFRGRELPLEDLISEGNLGLLRAAKRFDPARNFRFSTYACYWIKQAIVQALGDTSRTIRIPIYLTELHRKWRRTLARMPEFETTAERDAALRLNLAPPLLKRVLEAHRLGKTVPLSVITERGTSLSNVLQDQRDPDPEHLADRHEHQQLAARLLEKLGDREARVLRLRFGLDGLEPKTLQAIGDEIGLTRERVRQLEKKALDKLRRLLPYSD